MPSLFRATVGLQKRQWEWHRGNPGQISYLIQNAIDQQIASEPLPDGKRDEALELAAEKLFEDLAGEYAVSDGHIVRWKATAGQMKRDAAFLGIDVDQILACLDELWQIEWDHAIRAAAILERYKSA